MSIACLYYLSDSRVGLYLAEVGAIGSGADADLMDLAERAAVDPVIRRVNTQHRVVPNSCASFAGPPLLVVRRRPHR